MTCRKGTRPHVLGKSPQVPPFRVARSTKSQTGAPSSHKGTSTWHGTWSAAILPHDNTTWAGGLTGVVTHTFSHESVNYLVKLLEDIYRNKDIIAINNGSKRQYKI